MSAVYETVGYSVADGIATVTLNRPEGLNAWNDQLALDLVAAFAAAGEDSEARAVVLTGAGRAFSSGADLRSGLPMNAAGKPDLYGHLHDIFNPAILAVRQLPKPVVAAVNGGAVGIGVSLVLACDLIVAAESSYFLLAFANIGLSIDGGASALLAARVGFTRAAEMALLADRISPLLALDWGLINQVVPDDELLDTVMAGAAKLAAGPPGAYAAIKTLLNESCFAGLETAMEREAVLQQARGESEDFAEGVTAFLEKRTAHFSGR
jgi:2-(1,2-epoxy-1,2-dihydrophenyl)acetyl-CoA isomerase